MTTEVIRTLLQTFDAFQNVEVEAIDWLIEHSTYQVSEEMEIMVKPGEPINYMNIMLDGEGAFYIPQGNKLKELGVWKTGDVSGLLPFSRLTSSTGFVKILRKSHILLCHRDIFPELICQSYQLTKNLVAVMSNRIRNFTHEKTQDEKLMAMGKLSAGLAHELNNPASAMVRSAQKLYENIHTTPERFKQVMSLQVTDEQTDTVNTILFSRLKNKPEEDVRTLLEKESAMDDLLDWLEDRAIDQADEIAETLLEYQFTEDDLDEIESVMAGKPITGILRWIESTLSKENLINEIKESADRISSLVKSMKAYSRMDQDVDVEYTDIHKGIINTLIILKHKWKQKQIRLVKEFDKNLPNLKVHPGKLNQVWTNIIDNAIDAMDKGGQLTIKTFSERKNYCITIEDTGHGIPEDVLNRIFEPFFTTKGIGEGTGMGLDIVQRLITEHGGKIEVESQPGNTVFKISLPM